MSVLGELRSQVLSISFIVGVLGNLVASMLTARAYVVRVMRKHHAEHMAALARANRHTDDKEFQ